MGFFPNVTGDSRRSVRHLRRLRSTRQVSPLDGEDRSLCLDVCHDSIVGATGNLPGAGESPVQRRWHQKASTATSRVDIGQLVGQESAVNV